jgi:hypothetical protein
MTTIGGMKPFRRRFAPRLVNRTARHAMSDIRDTVVGHAGVRALPGTRAHRAMMVATAVLAFVIGGVWLVAGGW